MNKDTRGTTETFVKIGLKETYLLASFIVLMRVVYFGENSEQNWIVVP